MDVWLGQQIQGLFHLARRDTRYAQMQKKYNELEEIISDRLQSLPDEVQDDFWEFVCLSDAMNWCLLELILGGFPLQERENREMNTMHDDTNGGS